MYQKGSFGSCIERAVEAKSNKLKSSKPKRSLDANVGRPEIQDYGIPGRRPDVNGFSNASTDWFKSTDPRLNIAKTMDLEWALIRMCLPNL